jgi:hypothetical protein
LYWFKFPVTDLHCCSLCFIGTSWFPFLSKIFENKMCRIWSKQLGNEGIWAQHRWVSSFFHQWGGSSLILYTYFKNVFIIYSKYGSHQKILFVDFIFKIPVIVTSLCRENLMVASPKSWLKYHFWNIPSINTWYQIKTIVHLYSPVSIIIIMSDYERSAGENCTDLNFL